MEHSTLRDNGLKVNDKCPKCKKGILKNFPILGTDFLICSNNCGYKVYSSEKMDSNIEKRLELFMSDPWIPPKEKRTENS